MDYITINGKRYPVSDFRIPAADVRPVRMGKWNKEHLASTSGGTYPVVRCSVCRAQFPMYETPYCPNCGAEMEES